MLESGFFGTRALWFMDLVTLWFALLPFLLGGAIALVRAGRHRLHTRVQTVLFAVTLVMVVLFEVGVRMTGGYATYVESSTVQYCDMFAFLFIHIIVAIISVLLWVWLLVSAHRAYRQTQNVAPLHKKLGKFLFAGLTLTSWMGIAIYVILFAV